MMQKEGRGSRREEASCLRKKNKLSLNPKDRCMLLEKNNEFIRVKRDIGNILLKILTNRYPNSWTQPATLSVGIQPGVVSEHTYKDEYMNEVFIAVLCTTVDPKAQKEGSGQVNYHITQPWKITVWVRALWSRARPLQLAVVQVPDLVLSFIIAI